MAEDQPGDLEAPAAGPPADSGAAPDGARKLWLAAGLALASGLWAAFQWRELVVARSGGEAFCALGGSACAQLWDSAFARGVEGASGLPIAGWGAVWSLAALALPVLAALRLRSGRDAEPFASATALVAAVGAVVVALLGVVSVLSGGLCSNCVITYLLVVLYAAVLWLPPPALSLAAGVTPAAAAVGVGFALLLIPGLRTPQGLDAATRALLEEGPAASASGPRHGPDDLEARIAALDEEHRRYLATAVRVYQEVEPPPLRPARGLVGSPDAAVRLTHFSDVMCSHCRDFHEELNRLLQVVPEGSLSVEFRKFPLHEACNQAVTGARNRPERCLAATALICLEGRAGVTRVEDVFFERQTELTDELIFGLASAVRPRAEVERCVVSPETLEKLRSDVDWAVEAKIGGTPMVMLNGRRVPAYLPFIYAMAMTGGDTGHPVFADLPPPLEPTASR